MTQILLLLDCFYKNGHISSQVLLVFIPEMAILVGIRPLLFIRSF